VETAFAFEKRMQLTERGVTVQTDRQTDARFPYTLCIVWDPQQQIKIACTKNLRAG